LLHQRVSCSLVTATVVEISVSASKLRTIGVTLMLLLLNGI